MIQGSFRGGAGGVVQGIFRDAVNEVVQGTIRGIRRNAAGRMVRGALRNTVQGIIRRAFPGIARGEIRGAVRDAAPWTIQGVLRKAVQGAFVRRPQARENAYVDGQLRVRGVPPHREHAAQLPDVGPDAGGALPRPQVRRRTPARRSLVHAVRLAPIQGIPVRAGRLARNDGLQSVFTSVLASVLAPGGVTPREAGEHVDPRHDDDTGNQQCDS